MDKAQQDALKKAAGIEAASLVTNGMVAGLGTGSTVRFLVDELGRRVTDEGLSFTGVTKSSRWESVSARLYNNDSDERNVELECGLLLTKPLLSAAAIAFIHTISPMNVAVFPLALFAILFPGSSTSLNERLCTHNSIHVAFADEAILPAF